MEGFTMATVNSDIAGYEISGLAPASFLNPSMMRGKVRVVSGSYEAASVAAGTVIYLCKVYKDEVVLRSSSIMHDALSTGVTLAVGDHVVSTDVAGDADRYVEATSAASAGVIRFNNAATCINKTPFTMTADSWVSITTAGAAANGTIAFEIHIGSNN
jgi:hypothetical protein